MHRCTRLPQGPQQRPPVYLTRPEYEAFLAAFDPHWQPLVTTLFFTGARWGEVAALTVGDVDAQRCTLAITKAVDHESGEVKAPKTTRGKREVALAPEVMRAIAPRLDRPASAPLFVNRAGKRVGYDAFRRTWIATRKDIAKKPGIHDARHTNASWLLAAGVPLFEVSRHLGHESVTTTADRYGHLAPDAGDAIRAALG